MEPVTVPWTLIKSKTHAVKPLGKGLKMALVQSATQCLSSVKNITVSADVAHSVTGNFLITFQVVAGPL